MKNRKPKTDKRSPWTFIATPAIDFDGIVLKKGQRAPKGYKVIRIIADDLPAGWPPRKPYHCRCGCGKTYRVGTRLAIRNVRETGGWFLKPA
jgi:hypothetical protein